MLYSAIRTPRRKIVNRQELLAIVAASWQALDAAIDGLDERALAEAGVVGLWSVAEVIGHVTAWEQQALRHIEQWQRGEPLTTVGGPAVDDYNATEAARRQGWSLEQVRAEHQATRQRLRTAFEKANDADWSSERAIGDQKATLGDVVAGDLGGAGPGDHAAEHAKQILAWRNARPA
jgi:DinB superfamily